MSDAEKKVADEAIIRVVLAFMSRLSLQDMQSIMDAHREGVEAGLQHGVRAQIDASHKLSAAMAAAYSSLIEHDKEIIRANLLASQVMTTESLQKTAIDKMREDGCAVIVFEPEELEGVEPSRVEGAMIDLFADVRQDLPIDTPNNKPTR